MKNSDFSVTRTVSPKLKTYITALIISVVLCAVLLVIGALAITYANLKDYSLPIAILTIVISSFYGGFYCAKKMGSKGLLYGVAFGVLFFIVIYAIGSITFEIVPFRLNTLIRLLIMIVSGGVGGIVGVNAKKKKR